MDENIPYKQDLINNLIWYLIFNILSVWVGKPMLKGEDMSFIRTIFYLIIGFFWLGGWLMITKLIAQKKGIFLSLLITIPGSLILNYLIISIFNAFF